MLIRVTACLRVVMVCALVTVLLAIVLKRYVPDLEFDWGRALTVSFALFCGFMVIFVGLVYLVPSVIRISHRGIISQSGGAASSIFAADIRSVTVDASDPGHPLLCVLGKGKPLVAGIARKITPLQVVEVLKNNFPGIPIEERIQANSQVLKAATHTESTVAAPASSNDLPS